MPSPAQPRPSGPGTAHARHCETNARTTHRSPGTRMQSEREHRNRTPDRGRYRHRGRGGSASRSPRRPDEAKKRGTGQPSPPPRPTGCPRTPPVPVEPERSGAIPLDAPTPTHVDHGLLSPEPIGTAQLRSRAIHPKRRLPAGLIATASREQLSCSSEREGRTRRLRMPPNDTAKVPRGGNEAEKRKVDLLVRPLARALARAIIEPIVESDDEIRNRATALQALQNISGNLPPPPEPQCLGEPAGSGPAVPFTVPHPDRRRQVLQAGHDADESVGLVQKVVRTTLPSTSWSGRPLPPPQDTARESPPLQASPNSPPITASGSPPSSTCLPSPFGLNHLVVPKGHPEAFPRSSAPRRFPGDPKRRLARGPANNPPPPARSTDERREQ